ncbi:hypothetical protein TKK_0008478 [Trichogramma kaykai]
MLSNNFNLPIRKFMSILCAVI